MVEINEKINSEITNILNNQISNVSYSIVSGGTDINFHEKCKKEDLLILKS